MNLLGEYFVDECGRTVKPLTVRTDHENQFVWAVIFDEDDKGCCLYKVGEELLYKANGSNLQGL
jgi:hypothetical protein